MPSESKTSRPVLTAPDGGAERPDRTAADEVTGLDALELGPARQDGRAGDLGRAAWRNTWPKLLAIALVIAGWQLLYLSEWKPPFALPSPATVLTDLRELVVSPDFPTALAITAQRALTGFLLAVVIGTVIGAAVARFRPLRAAIGSLITGLQTMPSIIWFPFAILLFQISETAILFVVVIGAAPSIANGLIGGIDYVPPTWLRVGKVLGMRGLSLYRFLILPASLPSFISGLKQGWAFAWRSLMAGELLVIVAGQGSIGSLMQGAREFNNAPRLLSWIIIVLVLGILVDILFNAADNALRRRWGLQQS
ncbi:MULTISPECIES: ABC transporter permease [Micromonospora]|uniref:NitT/TauT family transport system permease protein n=1 Tax=Micromonospora yangpuensis TaxID=683228 RepID=A0A1C6V8L4_9ACTN|nr:ABC transporter permease [Micromonospora yangpuensis]GGM31880.1 sulfate ABC transporter permease [Micromonospora yangpuensis]SCL62693.1 NitT/TauT family transport system permease protein [Micromonospora yangpuensis]